MRALKASLIYFALVFAVGFLLGAIRVIFLVPALGIRLAELMELPIMVSASYLAACFVMRRLGPFGLRQRWVIGFLALAILVSAELALTVLSGQGIGSYIAGRDPVAGPAYLVALLLFAAMPAFAGRRRGG